MPLNKTWSSRKIISYFSDNRSKFASLYKGEKYLVLKYIKKNHTILDIGCAQGGMFEILKKRFGTVNYTGIDFNKKMINLAKKKYKKNIFFYYNKNTYYKFLKKKFDIVIIFGLLHLNPNWKRILINAYKVAKKRILFDLRFAIVKNKNLKNYLSLNFDKHSNKHKIPYILLNKINFLKFVKKNFKFVVLDNYSYIGKPSKYSSIQSKIIFANYCLKKNG